MAYKIQSSFSAGELDPALHERTTFDKYKTGLKTLRNAFIGKTGRVIGRGGTIYDRQTKYQNRESVLFIPPYLQYIIEWGHLYFRIHDTIAGTYVESAHAFTEDDLPYLQFDNNGRYFTVTLNGFVPYKIVLGALLAGESRIVPRSGLNHLFRQRYSIAFDAGIPISGTGTGYNLVYAATLVVNGEESDYSVEIGGKLPIAAGQSNTLSFKLYDQSTGAAVQLSSALDAAEIRVYRRPLDGAAYGFIGSNIYSGSVGLATFVDVGLDADYTHSPPTETNGFDGALAFLPKAQCFYQQRWVLSENANLEAIHASRPGYFNNFWRDYPLAADSALTFKCGTSGSAKVLRLMDNNGILVFTTVGIFTNNGALTPDNLSMEKKGNWVIDERVAPLQIPGSVLFVDRSTNTVRTLIYSTEAQGFPGEEVSIFSNHFFVGKRVKSWAFQDGDVPLVWVVFDDGSLVSLTYQREHQMQAWSRHDSPDCLYESVAVLKDADNKSIPYFIVKRGENRFIEKGADRFETDLKDLVLVDSAVTFKTKVTEIDDIDVTAVDINDWAGSLNLQSGSAIFANTAGNGAAGTVFRFFDSDGSAIDLTVTAFVNTQYVVVTPSSEFPAEESLGIDIYKTYQTLTGLLHLEGKNVSILADGYVLSSPNNDSMTTVYAVAGGQITLPRAYAIVHVGLPYVSDVEPLDIDTVEQKPTLLESMAVSKLYLKVYKTRGLFVGSEFPDGDSSEGLSDIETMTEDINFGVIGNKAQDPQTKRYVIPIPNSWNSNGRVCIRQVDPLPFEILSMIPDLSVKYMGGD